MEQERLAVMQALDYYEEAIKRGLGENILAALENWEPLTPGVAKASRRSSAPRDGRILAKGEKRTPAELETLTESLYEHVAANPDQRIEHIGKGMGYATKELSLPMKKLIAEGRIKAKGEKRATIYMAAKARKK